MIIRIVKMQFRPEEIESFLQFFEGRRSIIRTFEGCTHLELWQDQNDPGIFFTYSHWQSEAYLDAYRRSEFFDATWRATKQKFAGKAEAWTVNTIV